jgi:hypothetical protein
MINHAFVVLFLHVSRKPIVQHGHIIRTVELPRSCPWPIADGAHYRVIVYARKHHHTMKVDVRDEHLPRARHYRHAGGLLQRASGALQRAYGPAVMGIGRHNATVADRPPATSSRPGLRPGRMGC